MVAIKFLTDIVSVEIVHSGGGASTLGPCGNIQLQPLDMLRVDFVAYDAQGHLAWYDLIATYGENLASPLLGLPGATLTPLGGQSVPAALQVGPAYAHARLAGAQAPVWAGGAIRLEVPRRRRSRRAAATSSSSAPTNGPS